ncbi:glycoside hydrolase family 5 protein [Streptosporangium sp. 'caverna']|uniref:glycoside hydrolase family 5 protein n=1 Tax=Streptosporangium sp. 'caverna' TaxID=2202249 RepID=UPI000D7E83DF|nr:cellulase family glycosylhydrolase [Streptosporangium sp. 'caverna']AWS41636.1 glycoside hydrolase family 5 [Streptosporangium sp. 'caverna']
MTSNNTAFLRTAGREFVDQTGTVVRLRGVAVGGWLNMENFITGYSGNESLMRGTVREVLGEEKYELFFDRLLTAFFDEDDAKLLAGMGMNCVRFPVNYRHFEDDSKPFEFKEDGFRHLDRAIEACARHGIYSVIDLHALPGSQNHHWHSDNPTHRPAFFDHPHFQDRVVAIWERIAEHYRDNPWVAGYNPINEPADESRKVVGPFYTRLVDAIRAIDDRHILFLDGNTYSTEFDVFDKEWDNTVYVCHDYAAPGMGNGGDYPGVTDGKYYDKAVLEEKYLKRTEYSRQTGTPVWVGEFAPIYTGDERKDAMRREVLEDQLEIYRREGASWSSWMYKDLGRQGVAMVRPDSPYLRRFGDFVAKKNRLGADNWGSDGNGIIEVTKPFQDMIANEFPDFDPYPWGRFDWVRTLILNLAVAQPLAYEYAKLFHGLSDDELIALADSFALRNCDVRTTLVEQLRNG